MHTQGCACVAKKQQVRHFTFDAVQRRLKVLKGHVFRVHVKHLKRHFESKLKHHLHHFTFDAVQQRLKILDGHFFRVHVKHLKRHSKVKLKQETKIKKREPHLRCFTFDAVQQRLKTTSSELMSSILKEAICNIFPEFWPDYSSPMNCAARLKRRSKVLWLEQPGPNFQYDEIDSEPPHPEQGWQRSVEVKKPIHRMELNALEFNALEQRCSLGEVELICSYEAHQPQLSCLPEYTIWTLPFTVSPPLSGLEYMRCLNNGVFRRIRSFPSQQNVFLMAAVSLLSCPRRSQFTAHLQN
uniref:Uncharacterized protein n=1 Tax=Branchiostoma floridae TaxID=7739 RepID=C3XXD7_BRAFL|eukprot:XP_002611387.1 hypothetical protein BRAFLDRAFT_73216 [Branchiostoma floridae]